jgi:hemerythrin-like metal-binding protein
MTTLQWSDSLALGLPGLDDSHREFVDLLGAVLSAPNGELLARWSDLLEHTRAHFAEEEQWMKLSGDVGAYRHVLQHRFILHVMCEAQRAGLAGNFGALRLTAHELGAWFPRHVQGLDAELARSLLQIGARQAAPSGRRSARVMVQAAAPW